MTLMGRLSFHGSWEVCLYHEFIYDVFSGMASSELCTVCGEDDSRDPSKRYTRISLRQLFTVYFAGTRGVLFIATYAPKVHILSVQTFRAHLQPGKREVSYIYARPVSVSKPLHLLFNC